jgi:hypothetical protein
MTRLRRTALLAASLSIAAGPKPSSVYTGLGVYPKTVERWSRAIRDSDLSATSWIFVSPTNGGRDRLHKNGRRDTILVVPEHAHPARLNLVVWFHGLHGFSEKTFRNRLIPMLKEISTEEQPVAMVIPEMPWSTNTKTPRGRQGKVWREKGSLTAFIADTVEHLDVWGLMRHGSPPWGLKIVFAGFSAGGSALSSAAVEGSLCSTRPHSVVWIDASYDGWLDKAWKGCLQKSSTHVHVLVRKWDTPHHRADAFMKSIPKDTVPDLSYYVFDRKNWTHSDIGSRGLIEADVFHGIRREEFNIEVKKR